MSGYKVGCTGPGIECEAGIREAYARVAGTVVTQLFSSSAWQVRLFESEVRQHRDVLALMILQTWRSKAKWRYGLDTMARSRRHSR